MEITSTHKQFDRIHVKNKTFTNFEIAKMFIVNIQYFLCIFSYYFVKLHLIYISFFYLNFTFRVEKEVAFYNLFIALLNSLAIT